LLLLPVAGAQFAANSQSLLLSAFTGPVTLLGFFQFALQTNAWKAEGMIQNGHKMFSRDSFTSADMASQRCLAIQMFTPLYSAGTVCRSSAICSISL
jgi:hypothetical protein